MNSDLELYHYYYMKIIRSITTIFILLFSKLIIAQGSIDSLYLIVNSTKQQDTSKIKALIKLAEEIKTVDLDSSNQIIELAINKISKNCSSNPENKRSLYFKANALKLKGELFYTRGQMDSATAYLQTASEIYKKLTIESDLADTFMSLGAIYDYQAKTKEALEKYDFAYRIYQKNKDSAKIGLALNNLGVLFYGNGEPEKAMQYIQKCINIYRKQNDLNNLAWSLNNLGNMNMKSGNDIVALSMFRQALSITQKINSESGLSYTQKNLGNFYLKRKQLDSALYYHKKNLDVSLHFKSESSIVIANTNIGKVYYEMGQYSSAKSYGEDAYKISKNLHLLSRSYEVSALLKDVYSKTKEYDKALFFTNEWILLKDSIQKIENQKAAIKQSVQYEYEKKATEEKATQEKQNVIIAQEKQKEKIIKYAITSILVLVLLFAFFIYNRLKITNKQKEIIQKQKQLVEEKQKEIVDSIHYAKRIQKSLLPTEKYIDRVLSDLRKNKK